MSQEEQDVPRQDVEVDRHSVAVARQWQQQRQERTQEQEEEEEQAAVSPPQRATDEVASDQASIQVAPVMRGLAETVTGAQRGRASCDAGPVPTWEVAQQAATTASVAPPTPHRRQHDTRQVQCHP